MPNPFMRTGAAKSSQDPPDRERPTGALPPVLERVQPNTVFAYRGQETHGVPTDRSAVGGDANEYEDATRYHIDYAEPEPEPEPIPVRLVRDESIEIIRSVFSRMSATGTDKGGGASQLIGNDFSNRSRIIVRVKNVGTTTVYLGLDQVTASAQNGWPLAASETFECKSHEALWAIGTTAAETPVEVYSEFSTNVTHDQRQHGRN